MALNTAAVPAAAVPAPRPVDPPPNRFALTTTEPSPRCLSELLERGPASRTPPATGEGCSAYSAVPAAGFDWIPDSQFLWLAPSATTGCA